MKITRHNGTLTISDIEELGTANSDTLQSALTAALPVADSVRQIEIDFSETHFVDCGGLGALVALRKCARSHNSDVSVRLVNPPPPLQRMVTLMHMNEAFPIDVRAE
jgi:anti-anti-sigma factor